MPRSEIRLRARGLALVAAFAAAGPLGCIPLPVVVTPPVAGHVRDSKTGRPVAGAVVVVRFDARYDDLLPDRDVISHRELISAADGSFELGRSANAGIAVWPLMRSEARVVGVIVDGYRCPAPRLVSGGSIELDLSPALDDDDRRDSCRPIGARAADAPLYLAAWQALHPRADARAERRGAARAHARARGAQRLRVRRELPRPGRRSGARAGRSARRVDDRDGRVGERRGAPHGRALEARRTDGALRGSGLAPAGLDRAR